MKHGKRYSGGYDYKAIREYEAKIEKENALKSSLTSSSNRFWVTASVIAFISLCVLTLLAVKIYSIHFESRLRSDVTIYLNIREAVGNYLSYNGFEPDRNVAAVDIFSKSGEIYQGLVSSGRLEYKNFYSKLLQRSVIFRDCDDLRLGRLCVGFAQEKGAVTQLEAHVWPPASMPSISAAPVRYACVRESLYDDKNFYDVLAISKGSKGKELPRLCSEESMEADLTGEFDYIVAVGKL
jgi:hypothetical protein